MVPGGLFEGILRNTQFPSLTVLVLPVWGVPVPPSRPDNHLLPVGGGISFSGRGGGSIKLPSKVLNAKRKHIYSSTLIKRGHIYSYVT